MKPVHKLAFLAACSAVLITGCASKPTIQEHYMAFTPSDAQLQDYDVPVPPLSSQAYSTLTWDEKESVWTAYTNDLLAVIGKHMADKAGLRASKDELIKKLDELNKNPEKSP